MSDLVSNDESQQFSHQIVGKGKLLRPRIERAYLKEVPVLLEVLNVMVELNVRFKDLSRSRVMNIRT
jgi:hypothetical protein